MPRTRPYRLAALAIFALGALVAGCDGGATAPSQDGGDGDSPGVGPRVPTPAFEDLAIEPPDVHDVTGQYGGTFTWATVGEVASFNPIVTNTATESELHALVFDSLVTYDNAAWEHRPALAWKWEYSEDFLTWTFHI